MYKDPLRYKQFLIDYLELIEELFEDINNKLHQNSTFEPKQLAELRSAERSFNFLLNMFGNSTKWQVRDYFEMKEWNDIKVRRDTVASKISTVIENDPEIAKRYEAYCENLKDLRLLSSLI